MEPDHNQSFAPESVSTLRKVTPLSKYLAMVLFIILPFLGGYVGYVLAPEKVVEVERVVYEASEETVADTISTETNIADYRFVVEVEDPNWSESFPIYSTNTVSVATPKGIFELYSANELCVVREEVSDILDGSNGRSAFMKEYINSNSQISSEVSCWVAGGGYELYLIQNDDRKVQVIGFGVSESSADMPEDWSPFGASEILYPKMN